MTNRTALGAIALTALLVTAGCGGKKVPADQANGAQTTAGNETAAGAETPPPVDPTAPAEATAEETAPGNDVTPVKNLVAAHRPGAVIRFPPSGGGRPAGPVRIAAGGALSRYVDMHPREVEDGRSFLNEPVVRRAIAANVRDSAVRDFIFHYNGPDAPIARTRSGRIIAWGCEVHNCGFHNWAVSITPDGSSAEICHYQDDDRPDGTSTWYLRGGKTVKRAGNCPDE